MKIKRYITLLSAMFTALAVSASPRYVTSVEELNGTKNSVAPGDTIILRSGTYDSKTISFKANGTQAAPIVIMGEEPTGVVLTGNSRMEFSGSFLIFCNINFKDPVSQIKKAIIDFKIGSSNASNCRVTNCTISGSNLPQSRDDYQWVSLYGSNNQVDHCSFVDKRNMGTLLVVWLEMGVEPQHRILNNYFSRPTSLDEGANGQETIRIGTGAVSKQRAGCLVEGNHFYRCMTELEAVSNKSIGNIYRNNLFTESRTLTIRNGHDCLVENNYFVGNNTPLSAGVRIIGSGHTVRGNYMENLTDHSYGSAICIMAGTDTEKLKSTTDKYPIYNQVRSCLVEANTIVDCNTCFNINYGYNPQRLMTLPVLSTIIRNNTVSTKASTLAIDDTKIVGTEIKWENNTLFGGKYVGISTSEVHPTTKKPKIERPTSAINAIIAGCGPRKNVAENVFRDLNDWVVEIEPGGTVTIDNGAMIIDSRGGATVWYREPLSSPCTIRYSVTVVDQGGVNDRVSDLNCFVMAKDPHNPLFFHDLTKRTGKFSQYHAMELYYVGYAANENKTTRFRRYNGTMNRPLLPEHDLPGTMEGNRKMNIEIRVADGIFTYTLDGKTIFTYKESEPLTTGYFGLRTTRSRQKIENFEIIK